MLTTSKMRDKLRAAVKKAGSQSKWAAEHGVSPAYVCDALSGRRDIGEGIARPLGYEPVTVYVPVKEGAE